MKINAIAQVMRKSSSIELLQSEDEQYITNGYAIYSLNNLPMLNNDQMCALMGISEDKRGSYNLNSPIPIPEWLS